jgi:hypothetical protein
LFDGLGPELAPVGIVSARDQAPLADLNATATGTERKS